MKVGTNSFLAPNGRYDVVGAGESRALRRETEFCRRHGDVPWVMAATKQMGVGAAFRFRKMSRPGMGVWSPGRQR